MPKIHFFVDELDYSLEGEKLIRSWLTKLVKAEEKEIDEVNIIITSDEGLLKINQEFLKHDFYTDIITFQNEGELLSGEIYISLDRVRENALTNEVEVSSELHRVMAHGMLHMAGYGDKTPNEKKVMRAREDFYLNLREF